MKSIPLLIVVATEVVPILFSDRPKPKRQVRLLQITMAAIALVWALLCLFVYPRYVFPE
jgi:hypothetical protein